jgi:hypothetical protein
MSTSGPNDSDMRVHDIDVPRDSRETSQTDSHRILICAARLPKPVLGGSQISPTVLSRQMPVAASARRGSYVLFPSARTRFYGAAEQGVRLASSRPHLPLHNTHRTPRHPPPRHGVELDRNRSDRLEKSRRRWGGGMQGAFCLHVRYTTPSRRCGRGTDWRGVSDEVSDGNMWRLVHGAVSVCRRGTAQA